MGHGGSNRGKYPQLARADTGSDADRNVRFGQKRRPEGFAVLRSLDEDSQIAVSDLMSRLLSDRQVAHAFDFRDPDTLAVTEVAQHVTASQMTFAPRDDKKREVAGYLREYDLIPGGNEHMDVRLGGLKVFGGRILVANFVKGPLQDEVKHVHKFIDEEGSLRATPTHPIPEIPHLTLGYTVNNRKLVQSERDRLKDVTRGMFPFRVTLEPMEVFPPELPY